MQMGRLNYATCSATQHNGFGCYLYLLYERNELTANQFQYVIISSLILPNGQKIVMTHGPSRF